MGELKVGKSSKCFQPCMDKKAFKRLLGKIVKVKDHPNVAEGRVVATSIYGSALVQYTLGKRTYKAAVPWNQLEEINA